MHLAGEAHIFGQADFHRQAIALKLADFARIARNNRILRNVSYATVDAVTQMNPATMPAPTSEIQWTPRYTREEAMATMMENASATAAARQRHCQCSSARTAT